MCLAGGTAAYLHKRLHLLPAAVDRRATGHCWRHLPWICYHARKLLITDYKIYATVTHLNMTVVVNVSQIAFQQIGK